jgi:hypothetical protein
MENYQLYPRLTCCQVYWKLYLKCNKSFRCSIPMFYTDDDDDAPKICIILCYIAIYF